MAESDSFDVLDTEKKKEVKSEKKKDKVCNFFNTPRGCVKGEACDFQHVSTPTALQDGKPRQPIKNRICDFYMTPQGCVKGINCDFLHPRPGAGLFGIDGSITDPTALAQALSRTGVVKNEKPCSFFLTPRGCVKGEECDFQHIRPGQPSLPNPYLSSTPNPYLPSVNPNPYLAAGFGTAEGAFGFPGFGLGTPGITAPLVAGGRGKKATKPKICDFHNSERGCVKGDACDFIHQKNRVCDFYLTPRGCRKGALCDFQHPAAKEGETAVVTTETPSSPTSGKAKSTRTTSKRYEPY